MYSDSLTPRALALAGLGSLPWAGALVARSWKARERREMSMVLVGTAKLHARAGLLYAAGLTGHVVFSNLVGRV